MSSRFRKDTERSSFFPEKPGTRKGALHRRIRRTKSLKHSTPGGTLGILTGGVQARSPNPNPISDLKRSFFTPVFRSDL